MDMNLKTEIIHQVKSVANNFDIDLEYLLNHIKEPEDYPLPMTQSKS